PNVAEDHQTKNARALSEKDAAWMVKDMNAPEQLIQKALELLKDTTAQEVLIKNIKAFAKPNATEKIVDKVFEIMNEIKK
ncbi:MAG TPA: glycosyltransferase, partial [Cytophaga sp.]|nr:glycosyltransferase [Cytophaga sp.]